MSAHLSPVHVIRDARVAPIDLVRAGMILVRHSGRIAELDAQLHGLRDARCPSPQVHSWIAALEDSRWQLLAELQAAIELAADALGIDPDDVIHEVGL